jgi:hypothetical protein
MHAARVVSQSLFRRAQDLLGDAGIVDVTVLIDRAVLPFWIAPPRRQ